MSKIVLTCVAFLALLTGPFGPGAASAVDIPTENMVGRTVTFKYTLVHQSFSEKATATVIVRDLRGGGDWFIAQAVNSDGSLGLTQWWTWSGMESMQVE